MERGILVNQIIDRTTNNFDLEGMISPTFFNQGDTNVYLDGRLIAPNKTFVIEVPSVILTNKISIYFEKTSTKTTNKLYISYIKLDENNY